jgi:hypothetical protein
VRLTPGIKPLAITAKRLALCATGLLPIVFLILLFWVDLERRIPAWFYWKAALVFLIALEIAYALAVSLAIAGPPLLGYLAMRRRSLSPASNPFARPLLLCVALLLASVAVEAACAFWLNYLHRSSAMPLGGFREADRSPPAARFQSPIADFALPTDFPDPPDDLDIDLVVLGESSAEGVPYSNWLSIASLLKWKLSEAIPGRRIRPRVLARSGDTLEWQHRELPKLARRPELLIIYCGHNEFTSRLAESRDLDHYFDLGLPSAWDMFCDRFERSSQLCGLIRETAEKCRIAIPPASEGRRKLVDVPFYTPAENATLLGDFRRRLETIVSYAERIGALSVLIAPAANDAGFEPNRSFLAAKTTRAERESFQREFRAARRLELDDPAASVARYRALLARDPGFAESHYRLARLLERAGASDQAYEHYIAARDCDGYPMRCLSAFQQVYHEVASRHECIFIDAQSVFHAIGRHGLLDDELFQDAMHPSLKGQIILAQAVLQALHARRAFGWPAGSPAPVIDPAECAARFGLGPAAWRVICLWGLKFNSLAIPLRYDAGRRRQARDAYAAAADRIAAGAAPESLGMRNIGIPAAVRPISGTASPGK